MIRVITSYSIHYTKLYDIAEAQPRLAGVLVIIMLAVIGSPLFPAFFALLDSLMHAVQVLPVAALGVGVVWMLWSWSGIQLLQLV